jgi:hypothetical protein
MSMLMDVRLILGTGRFGKNPAIPRDGQPGSDTEFPVKSYRYVHPACWKHPANKS